MEKFRAVLEVLKKYHFWILCGLIVLLSFGSWYFAASDEEQHFVARKGQIGKQFDDVDKIARNNEHPSEKYIQEIRARDSGALAAQVANAATHLYSEQRESNPLPKVFPLDKNQREFKAAFEKACARPIEDIPNPAKLPPKDQLDDLYRSRYRDHIQEHFPKLFELIERRTTIPGGGTDQTPQTTGIVDWLDADQKIDAFKARFSGPTPNTLDVAMAQEDLWVYETLLKVIHNTNDFGPDPRHEKNYQKPPNHKVARIKKIWSMDIGKDAVDAWSRCEKDLFTLPNDGSGSSAASASSGDVPPAVAPLIGRYVDDKGKPVLDPTHQPFPEFRMMPINLKVDIEQKDIPRLLAECANSAMRIDVRAVRVLGQDPGPVDLSNPDAPADSAAATTTGASTPAPTPTAGPSPGRRKTSRVRPDRGGGPSTVNPRQIDTGNDKGPVVPTEESADPIYPPVPVEVQGIIYIYNPPPDQIASATTGAGGGPAGTNAGGTNPAAGSGAAAPATPAATTNPVPGPAAVGTPINPPATTPAPGGRP